MNETDIDKMEAGRELDAKVTWEIMGFEGCVANTDGTGMQFPPYSTDIATAWLVVEKMKTFSLGRRVDGSWQCWHWNGTHLGAHGETAPLAICRAALKALAAEQQPEQPN